MGSMTMSSSKTRENADKARESRNAASFGGPSSSGAPVPPAAVTASRDGASGAPGFSEIAPSGSQKSKPVELGNLRAETSKSDFDTTLCAPVFGCQAPCGLTCAAMCCPCYVIGANAKMLHSGAYHDPCVDIRGCKRSEPCMKFVFPYACIAFWGYWFAPCGPFSFVPGAMFTASYRHKTRKQFGITSSAQCVPGFSNDICMHLFCFPFAICQEHVELKRNVPFVPLKRLYDDRGESLGIKETRKPKKWTFDLDAYATDDEGEDPEVQQRRQKAERRMQNTVGAPGTQGGMSRDQDAGSGSKKLSFKQDDRWIDGSCQLCGAGPYHQLDGFSDHMVTHTNLRKIHEAIQDGSGTVRCNACKKSFNNVPALGQHKCKPAKKK